VGAGISGILTAARLHQAHPDCKIRLLEKEAHLGGRLTAQSIHQRPFPIFGMSRPLFQFVNQTLRQDPDHPDLETFVSLPPAEEIGFLCGSELHLIPREKLLTESMLKLLAGPQVARQWPELQEWWTRQPVLSSEGEATTKKKPNEKIRSHQALSVLFQLADSAHIWNFGPEVWQDRAQALASGSIRGNWMPALSQLRGDIPLQLNTHVLSAKREHGHWKITTPQETIESRWLVVAQPPWSALDWLDRNEIPPAIFQRASKTQPVSTVLLSERLLKKDDRLPLMVFVPAQATSMLQTQGELTFYTHIDYETSLDALSVVKAIRRLRRAREKVRSQFSDLLCEGEYVALRTINSVAPHRSLERKICEKIQSTGFPESQISFCGEAYGYSSLPDEVLIRSVLAAVESFR